MKRKLRIANVLFWLAVWAGIVFWTDAYGHWFVMVMQGFVPIMLGGSVHIALRDGTPES